MRRWVTRGSTRIRLKDFSRLTKPEPDTDEHWRTADCGLETVAFADWPRSCFDDVERLGPLVGEEDRRSLETNASQSLLARVYGNREGEVLVP